MSPEPLASPTHGGTVLRRIFEFDGKGYQPELARDARKKIQWVEVGQLDSSIHGEDFHGGGADIETFDQGRVGLANGSVLSFKSIKITKSLDGALALVEGS